MSKQADMNLLAIETTGSLCSVALKAGSQILECSDEMPNRHSQVVLDYIHQLLADSGLTVNGLDAIAVGNGPGSFTGIRLGLGVAQGLAFGIEKPVLGISSLKNLAVQSTARNIIVALDARIGEIYWQCFHKDEINRLTALTDPQLSRPEAVCIDHLPETPWHGIGSGFDLYAGQLSQFLQLPGEWMKSVKPNARAMIHLALLELSNGQVDSAKSLIPQYIRNKVTQ